MVKALSSFLILLGLLTHPGDTFAQEDGNFSVEELGRWGSFSGERVWEQRTKAICGLDGGGFAIILADGTLERFDQLKPLGEPVSRDRIALPAEPVCLLQLNGDLFLTGTDSGQLFLIDLGKGNRVEEWPAPSKRWQPVSLARRIPQSTILVADRLQGRVWELDAEDGRKVHSWDGFIDPTGVTAAGEAVWVTDRGWHRLIPCYDGESTGRIDDGIGDHGAAPGLFASPTGCAGISEQWIFVSDSDNHRVQIIGRHGVSLHSWGLHALKPRESRGRLHYPGSLVFDPSNRVVVVLEPSESRVQLFGARDPESRPEAAEEWQRVDLISHFGRHWSLDRGPRGFLLAVLEPDAERVVVLDRRSANPIEIDDVGGHGSKATQFRTPSGIDFMKSGGFPRFVVADRGNHRLQMFEVRRQPEAIAIREAWITALIRTVDLKKLASNFSDWKGSVAPKPGAVACLESGLIAVVDEASPRILLLDRRFHPVGILGSPEELRNPVALAADGDGVLVADAGAHRIVRFGLDKTMETLYSGGSAGDQPIPAGVARHPDGSCYWTDSRWGRLFRIRADGRTDQVLGIAGLSEATSTRTGERELFRPGAVQITPDGEIWIVDHGNHRGVVLDPHGELRHFGSRPYLPESLKNPEIEEEE